MIHPSLLKILFIFLLSQCLCREADPFVVTSSSSSSHTQHSSVNTMFARHLTSSLASVSTASVVAAPFFLSPLMTKSHCVSSQHNKFKLCLSTRSNSDTNESSTTTTTTSANNAPRKRIRVISCDVTGTLVSFLGKIEDHYGNAARTCGIDIPPSKESSIGKCFNRAYRETCTAHPCFGNSTISSKEWWRQCVRRSFDLVLGDTNITMTGPEHERVFQRVYSTFGSHAAYGAFPDAFPFLKWAHRRGISCGVISNADERYGDSILPMLGLGDDMKFFCFSKNVGFEKPSKEIFEAAIVEAEPWLCLEKMMESDNMGRTMTPLKPEEILHIGNDFKKDYVGAKEAGFHAVLLDRYDEKEIADEWRAGGAPVFKDLIDVVEYLGREQFELGSRDECMFPLRGEI